MSAGRRIFWLTAIAVGAAFAAGLYVAGLQSLSQLIRSNPGEVFGVLVGAIYVAFFALVFLNTTLRKAFIRSINRFNRALAAAIQTLIGLSPVSASIEGVLTRKDLEEIFETQPLRMEVSGSQLLAADVQAEVAEIIRKELAEKLSSTVQYSVSSLISEQARSYARHQAIDTLDGAAAQLRAAASTVTIRGFVNLLIGIAFAIGALYFLRESVLAMNPEQLKRLTMPEVTYFVGIRVSLALIITLIAYFFLSLYRRSLEDVKYYQNEVTYLSGRSAALSLVHSSNDKDSLLAAVPLLMDSDRNRSSTISSESNKDDLTEKVVLALIEKIPGLKSS